MFFVRNHLCDSAPSLCDPPKDANVQHYLQSWALNKKVTLNR